MNAVSAADNGEGWTQVGNVSEVEKALLVICLMCQSKERVWSKMTPKATDKGERTEQ